MIVYSAIYGDYDELTQVTVDVEHVLFTDRPPKNAAGWTVEIAPSPWTHPRMAAKWWKLHPPFDGHCLWIDGNISVNRIGFVEQVDRLLDDADLAMQRHWKRDCIYAEAIAADGLQKCVGFDVVGQADRYRQYGWPEHAGLWQSGILGWSGSVTARQLGAAWFTHCELLTPRDQVSLPVLAARYDARIADIPLPFWNNPGFSYGPHRRND